MVMWEGLGKLAELKCSERCGKAAAARAACKNKIEIWRLQGARQLRCFDWRFPSLQSLCCDTALELVLGNVSLLKICVRYFSVSSSLNGQAKMSQRKKKTLAFCSGSFFIFLHESF